MEILVGIAVFCGGQRDFAARPNIRAVIGNHIAAAHGNLAAGGSATDAAAANGAAQNAVENNHLAGNEQTRFAQDLQTFCYTQPNKCTSTINHPTINEWRDLSYGRAFGGTDNAMAKEWETHVHKTFEPYYTQCKSDDSCKRQIDKFKQFSTIAFAGDSEGFNRHVHGAMTYYFGGTQGTLEAVFNYLRAGIDPFLDRGTRRGASPPVLSASGKGTKQPTQAKIEKVLENQVTWERARNLALNRVGNLGHDSKPIIGTLGKSAGYGKVIGRQSADGKKGWRLDYDPVKGPHINIFGGVLKSVLG